MPRRTVVAKLTIRSMSYDVGKRQKPRAGREGYVCGRARRSMCNVDRATSRKAAIARLEPVLGRRSEWMSTSARARKRW
jgi:hypothetical protein